MKMTVLNILFDSDKIEAIKTAVGTGTPAMRSVYQDLPVVTKAEDGTESTTILPALDRAKAAYAKAAELAILAGVRAYRPMKEVKDEATGEVTEEPDDSAFDNAMPVVAVVGARERKPGETKMSPGIRAVVLFPIPTIDAFIETSTESKAWLNKIAEKESAHVAFRALRNAETQEELDAAAKGMPISVGDFIERQRIAGESDTDVFIALWKEVKPMLKAAQPTIHDLLPPRGELIKAIRSKAYAESEAECQPLEAAGIFVGLANAIIKAGASFKDAETGELTPMDTSSIQNWLAERDSFIFQTAAKDFSVLTGKSISADNLLGF